MRKISLTTIFWQTVKPIISDEVKLREKITLVENEKALSECDKVAKSSKDVLLNVVKNLNISEYKVEDVFHQNIRNYPTLKTNLKYRKCP